MRASLIVGLVGAVALAVSSPAFAKGGGKGHGVGKGPGSHAAFSRGVGMRSFAHSTRRPPGWSRGNKTGWRCTVGAPGCIPPGLR